MPVPRRVLDPGAQHFVADWGQAVTITTPLLRAEAGRYPNDKALRNSLESCPP
ncbi:hypothetical protein [Streptomyces sp. NPDC058084]|uniref:hypothetical protein n=1 Tax=Streptomyces sp. NPDC058084 TaxID=3346333 RepID=UPI0036E484D8